MFFFLCNFSVRSFIVVSVSQTDAECISVDPGVSATPVSLRQNYVVVPAQHKLSALFSFLRTHSSKKILVFVSSCKQTRFLYEAFRILKPGLALMYLHGRQKQQKRLEVFQSFVDRTGECCLISTDLASRGIDFTKLSLFETSKQRSGPRGFGKRRGRREGETNGVETTHKKGAREAETRGVDFVVQLDCPDSVETYIHRVGRTARMQRTGQALLMILPSETKFVDRLRDKKIEMQQLFMNPKKAVRVENKLQSILAQNTALKLLAQQALSSYLRCVALMPDKSVFSLPTDKKALTALANAYGLSLPPNVTLLADEKTKNRESQDGDEDELCTGGAVAVTEMKKKKNLSKLERFKEKIRQKKAEKAARQHAQRMETETEATETEKEEKEKQEKKEVRKKREETERTLTLLQEREQNEDEEGGEEAAANLDDDGLLVLKDREDDADLDEKERGRLLHEQLMRKPGFRRERLRFRADGTAKVKGLAAASLHQSHVFFGDEEDEEDEGDSGDEGDRGDEEERRGEEGEGDLPSASGRAAFLRRMREKVMAAQHEDKERNRQRIHELHTKQRQKARARRQAQAAEQGNAPHAVLDLRSLPGDEEEGSAGERGDSEEEAAESDRRLPTSSSESESEMQSGKRQPKRRAREEERATGRGSKRQRSNRSSTDDTDNKVEEQDLEALALQVLQGKNVA
ncbi:DEAD/DEAH box helicase domain-containing protein [Toxoplasma gondii FOU]|uniref:ATP-dependent RNA helicase n=1 Tax=Toxoplasma gondii FOU TaxID=943167 RepID=A0A086L4C4_TOXGO|nr:DEAD/DEAH box helicase domain-containing protein [Toxoplasma gondii FOU]